MQKTIKSKSLKQKQARDLRHFAAIVGVIVGSFLLVSSIAAYFYVQTSWANPDPPERVISFNPAPEAKALSPNKPLGGWRGPGGVLQPPEKTNFLVAGLDAGDMLADTILVGSFDRDTHEITIISIPRDTRIILPREEIAELNSIGRYPPRHGIMKINSISAYAGKNYGMEYLKRHLERMLEIEINYHVMVDLRAFRNIVDAVGGVYMEIPGRGLYYEDPYQNLVIRIPGGYQLLDGEKAEGVVRFRATYRDGDLQRIGVQQEFMKQFFTQLLDKDNIMKNLLSYITTVVSYVRTDFGLQDIPLYMRYASKLSAENISFLTLPGHAPAYNEGEASYFYHDPELTAQMVQEVFYNNYDDDEAASSDIIIGS